DAGARRLLAALARVHVHGVSVDWAAVTGSGQRVELPTYAFQRQRYWPQATRGLRSREQDRSATQDWRYRVSWVPVPEPSPAMLPGTWLLVVPAGRPGATLAGACARALAARGARTVVVEAAADELDRRTLAARIAADAGPGVCGVLSLLALDEAPAAGYPVLSSGLAGTQELVQALGDAGLGAPLWVLTCGAVAAGEELARPVQAMAWGLGRVAGLEHPDRWGGLIDLPPVLDERAAARLCAVLAGIGEDQVAIRGPGILARRLTRAAQPRGGQPWMPGGTVLITGGTGAIGGHVARWLASRGAPGLVLSSRSGPAAPGATALAASLAQAGANVDVIASDTADRAQVAGLLARIAANGPPLAAVLHAAGIGQATALADTTAAELAAVVAAKAASAGYLDELTADLGLERFVLFSSIAATWGSGLQPGYAAANTFLDALAQARRAAGGHAASVAWGPWGGGGMTDREGAQQLERRGLRVMDPAALVRVLAEVVDGAEGLVTVADVDWARFAPPFTLRRPSPLIEALPEVAQVLAADAGAGLAAEGAGLALEQRLTGLAPDEQERILVGLVRSEAAAVLGHASPDAVQADRAFSELGFDSLTAVELRNRLAAATGLTLPATLVFDYPTARALADFIDTQLSGVTTPAHVEVAHVSGDDDPIVIVGMACRYPGGVTTP
ncbi:MAG TPA: beta-ketoacyl reductase, partial [Streptosporangiaceae bacterium]